MTHAPDENESIAARISKLAPSIAALNPQFHAFSHVAPIDPALVARLDAERATGKTRSAIHGLTVSVKGNIPIAGLPWTEGSAVHAGRVAAHDAAIVTRAREAGGIIVGATTLSELAMYGVENPFETMGLNPWDVARTAGGSSTGAGVACALRLADVNIGTDAGGSIRNPALHCGGVGFMPRIGALTTEGKSNYNPSVSSVGLITRSVDLLTRAFVALGGDTGTDEPARRLLVPAQLIATMADEATRALFATAQQALRVAGFAFVEREVDGWMAAETAAGVISLSEGGAAFAAMDLRRAGKGIRDRAAQAAAVKERDVAAARDVAQTFKKALCEALDAVKADAVLTPTWPFAAHLIHAETANVNGREVPINPYRNCFVRAANAIDACAITLPAGLYPRERVPFGIQLMAPGGRDHLLLITGAAAEAALPRLPEPPALRAVT